MVVTLIHDLITLCGSFSSWILPQIFEEQLRLQTPTPPAPALLLLLLLNKDKTGLDHRRECGCWNAYDSSFHYDALPAAAIVADNVAFIVVAVAVAVAVASVTDHHFSSKEREVQLEGDDIIALRGGGIT